MMERTKITDEERYEALLEVVNANKRAGQSARETHRKLVDLIPDEFGKGMVKLAVRDIYGSTIITAR